MARELKKKMKKEQNNADQLVELLVQSAERELATFYYYTLLCVCLDELEGGGIRDILEAARIKDRKHFEALAERIYELGGSLPSSIKELVDIPVCSSALSGEPQNVQKVLHMLIEAERCAVRGYTRICNLTAGRDQGTYLLALKILNEELEHKAWFSQFLCDSPPGTSHDTYSPYAIVSK